MLVLTPAMGHQWGWALGHEHVHPLQGHFHWLSWQGACVFLLMTAVIWTWLVTLWRKRQQHQSLRTLLAFSERDDHGRYRVESDIPNAFTVGLWWPKILISRALEQALSADELDIVYRHESAHQQARDPLRLGLFKMLIVVFVPCVRNTLYATFELIIEQQADAVVVNQCGDPSMMAATLVKVHRLALRHQNTLKFSICTFYTTSIEARVRQLLAADQGRVLPSFIFIFSLTLLVSVFALSVMSIYSTHGLHHRSRCCCITIHK